MDGNRRWADQKKILRLQGHQEGVKSLKRLVRHVGALGLDYITAITGAATAICNVGPAMGAIIGPNGTFASLPDTAKWLLSAGMLFGRLEIFTVLVLFLPSFWRN